MPGIMPRAATVIIMFRGMTGIVTLILSGQLRLCRGLHRINLLRLNLPGAAPLGSILRVHPFMSGRAEKREALIIGVGCLDFLAIIYGSGCGFGRGAQA